AEGEFVQQATGKSQYGHVVLEVSQLKRGSGYLFNSDIDEELIPEEFIPAIQKGIEGCKDGGPLLGFPVIDVQVTLTGGSYHEEDSTEQAFGVAAAIAFRKAAEKAKPVLLEPLMDVEIILPEQYLGDVIGDLNSRRAKINGMDSRDNGFQVITAQVALAEMFGYSTDLRSITQGRANFTMQFANYGIVPENMAQKIIKKVKGII
ncbi:MAG: elongation factor G, partial [Deltaproteobacteria bacterium]|nr:elongation factor G [Deltaproteobacteria bacterium]